MKKTTLILSFLLSMSLSYGQDTTSNFVTFDIDNFWAAYDKITTTKDTTQQLAYLNTLFLDKKSVGLAAFMEVRDYTPQSYLEAINSYPLFWQSIRANTFKTAGFIKDLEPELVKFKALYPDLKPAKMYFTIGALRSPGTTQRGLAMIGAELAFSDKNTVSSEFPVEIAKGRRTYFDSNPINEVVLLYVHEYVHTQQNPIVQNLLSLCMYEGIAEFVSCKITGKPSSTPSVSFGKNNEVAVKKKFEEEMFRPRRTAYWLWSDVENVFKIRDLGYYIGYGMAEIYYEKAADKKQAIKEMIELDYENEKQIENFVDGTQFLSASLEKLYDTYEQSRPKVLNIKQFKNGSETVSPNSTQITVKFSKKMDKRYRSQDVGPLGKAHFPTLKTIDFSEDGLSITINVALEPNKQYQLLLESGYRSEEGIPLKPFLINFKTGEK
jgi:hypothetical protein